MKIAVSSTGKTLDSAVEVRFGRCPYFLIVNPATLEFEAIANANVELMGGVGIQSAQLIAEKGASVLLTGRLGPNAVKVLEQGGVRIVTGVSGTVLLAVQQFAAGSLKSTPSATGASPGGQGQAMGRGMGGGGRKAGGMGRGRGMSGGKRVS